MRTVFIPPLGRRVSAIGFGCASLGSRISPSQGFGAMAQALDLGVTWFDVAPPYGDGHAEALLGQALRGRRDRVVICTKFGIEPPQLPLAARLIRPLARQVVATLPKLRQVVAAGRPTGARTPIDPAAIEASVTRSLRLLKTDYIDVLAVHEPTPCEVGNGAVFEVLQQLRERGRIRAISVAGPPEAIEAAARVNQPIDIAQFPDTPFGDAPARLRHALGVPGPSFVTHGVFGSGITERMAVLTGPQREWMIGVAERYGIDISRSLHDLLLNFAFSNNPDGVVIISMFNMKHIERNVAAACRPAIPGFADAIRGAFASA
jgi:aryl-alcohol dehydrogenase-like predicted oxidoreductase